jgi:8-oxo-dGTP diphosphatase
MIRDRVAGMVIHKDHILLMFRRNKGKEYFTFPGGGIEAKENLEQAVVRELWEETSVNVKPERILYDIDWDHTSHQKFFLCLYLAGEPKLGDFVEKDVMKKDKNQYYDPRWIRLTDLPQLLLYPLEIKEWLLQDLKNSWPKETRSTYLQLLACRQL